MRRWPIKPASTIPNWDPGSFLYGFGEAFYKENTDPIQLSNAFLKAHEDI